MSAPDGDHEPTTVERALALVQQRLAELRHSQAPESDNVIDLAAQRAMRRTKRAGYAIAGIVLGGVAWLLRPRVLAGIGLAAAAGAIIGAIIWAPSLTALRPDEGLPTVAQPSPPDVTDDSPPLPAPTQPVPTTTPSREETSMPTVPTTTPAPITRSTPPNTTRDLPSSTPANSTPSTIDTTPTPQPGDDRSDRHGCSLLDLRVDPLDACLLPTDS